MPFTVEINGFTIHAETVADVRALISAPPVATASRTLKEVLSVAGQHRVDDAMERARKKTTAAPVGRPRTFRKPPPLTPEEKKAMSADVPALICRKPLGCGKAFASSNRKAWYCPSCTAKRDEGRPV